MAKPQVSKVSDGMQEKVISVNRVTKVVKGGRVISFSSLVIVGNGSGKIAIGKGKSKEVSISVQKAADSARKKFFRVPIKNGTFPHTVIGKHGASSVMISPAKAGTGVIAGGAMRALFEVLGVTDVVAKSHGSSTPHNMLKAAFSALKKMKTPSEIANKRGMDIKEIFV